MNWCPLLQLLILSCFWLRLKARFDVPPSVLSLQKVSYFIGIQRFKMKEYCKKYSPLFFMNLSKQTDTLYFSIPPNFYHKVFLSSIQLSQMIINIHQRCVGLTLGIYWTVLSCILFPTLFSCFEYQWGEHLQPMATKMRIIGWIWFHFVIFCWNARSVWKKLKLSLIVLQQR